MKQITFASIALLAVLFAACSKDNDTPSNSPKQEKQEQPVSIEAGSLRFNFTEEGFGEDVETTRAAEMPKEEVVDIGNGLEARICVERDPVPAVTRAPKPIADGNYTIVAFKGMQRLDQKITFTVTGGVTTITSPKGRYSWVANETYTFVCFNDKMEESYGSLFTQVGDFTGALFDRQTITINNADQDLTFQMKHASFRVRTKVESLEGYPVITSASIPAGNSRVIGGRYNLLTGVPSMPFINIYNTATPQTYTNSGAYTDADLEDNIYTATANEYDHYIAGTPQTLFLACAAGTLYGRPLQFTQSVTMLPSEFKANGSYTVKIKLMPRYLYLFEDGQTGYLSSPNRQNHVPIAVVFDPSGKRAVSLWDANNGNGVKWDTNNDYAHQRNSIMFTNPSVALSNTTSGKLWTWEKNFNGNVKANVAQFPPYHYAGKFYNSTDLTSKLTSKGKTLNTSLNKDNVWYLPSLYEWKEVFSILGFGNNSQVNIFGAFQWKGSMVNYAFKAANGTSIANNGNIGYWSSSEYYTINALYVSAGRQQVAFSGLEKKWSLPHVRPFISY